MHAGSNIGSNWHKDILNAWTPENKNTNVPIMDGAQIVIANPHVS